MLTSQAEAPKAEAPPKVYTDMREKLVFPVAGGFGSALYTEVGEVPRPPVEPDARYVFPDNFR